MGGLQDLPVPQVEGDVVHIAAETDEVARFQLGDVGPTAGTSLLIGNPWNMDSVLAEGVLEQTGTVEAFRAGAAPHIVHAQVLFSLVQHFSAYACGSARLTVVLAGHREGVRPERAGLHGLLELVGRCDRPRVVEARVCGSPSGLPPLAEKGSVHRDGGFAHTGASIADMTAFIYVVAAA